MKYAVNKSNTISQFDTGATISSMSNTCFDQLQPKPALVQTHTYKVNGANSNSHCPIRMTTCTFTFPKKYQQEFIVCKHLL